MPGAIRILDPVERGRSTAAPPDSGPPSRVTAITLAIGTLAVATLIVVDAVFSDSPGPSELTPPQLLSTDAVSVDPSAPGGRLGELPVLWEPLPGLDDGGHINDIAAVEGLALAVGRSGGDAAAWITNAAGLTSRVTRPAAALNAGDGPDRSIHAVAASERAVIAVGSVGDEPAVWLGPHPSWWDLLTPRGLPADAVFLDVASLDATTFAAIVATGGRTGIWSSSDGRTWNATEIPEEAGFTRVVLVDRTLFATGNHHGGDGAVPAIWTSRDGVAWSRAEGLASASSSGAVRDVARTATGFVAVGADVGEAGLLRAAVWLSPDGQVWEPAAREAEALQPAFVTFRVDDVKRVGDAHHAVISGPGGQVEMSSGPLAPHIEVLAVVPGEVEFSAGGRSTFVPVGEELVVAGAASMSRIVSLGNRVMALGEQRAPGASVAVPVAWSSTDSGRNWSAAAMPDAGVDVAGELIAYRSGVVALANETASGRGLVSGLIDTTTVAEAAVAAVEKLFLAVERDDVGAVLRELAPQAAEGRSGFADWPHLPGPVQWWPLDADGSTRLDTDAVARTVAYLAQVPGVVSLSDCTGTSSASDLERTLVRCRYSTTGGTLRALVPQAEGGTISATVVADRIGELARRSNVDDDVWLRLAAWAALHRPNEFTMSLGTIDDTWHLAPVVDGTTAEIHEQLAEELAAATLTPGLTRVFDSPFGEVAVSAPTVRAVPDDLSYVVHDGERFVGLTRGGRTWFTADGVRWEVGPPVPVDEVWHLGRAGDALVALAFNPGFGIDIWRYDGGDAWSAIARPWGLEPRLGGLVTFGESVLLDTWTPQGEPAGLWFAADGLSFDGPHEQLDFPAATATYTAIDGELFAVVRNEEEDTHRVLTPDEGSWEDAGTAAGLRGWSLDTVTEFDGALVGIASRQVGECGPNDFSGCVRSARLVTSADGLTWTVASSDVALRDPQLATLATGPLGAVAWGWDSGPVSLWAAQADAWAPVPFEYTETPAGRESVPLWLAVGSDTILMGVHVGQDPIGEIQVIVVEATNSQASQGT